MTKKEIVIYMTQKESKCLLLFLTESRRRNKSLTLVTYNRIDRWDWKLMLYRKIALM